MLRQRRRIESLVGAAALLLVVMLVAAGCRATAAENTALASVSNAPSAVPDAEGGPAPTLDSQVEPGSPTPDSQVEPGSDADPEATSPSEATAEPTSVPETDPTSEPTSVPETAESDSDTSPVVIDGGEWTVTQNDVERIRDFIELTHELEFTGPVGVEVSDDIGLEYAAGFEPFSVDEWVLLQALGLASPDADRRQANQLRLDRIRGLCCDPGEQRESLSVVMEVQPTKFATELILMHELVHALHVQHPSLNPRQNFGSRETPFTFSASVEGVPQYVVFQYLAMASEEDIASVAEDLPIIRDDMMSLIDSGPARHLNWAYATGADFVDGVVTERGAQGLSDLLRAPPVTNEQVLFPEKYLAGEDARMVAAPVVPADAVEVSAGTIGAALLLWVLADQAGAEAAREFIAEWAGDSYVIYRIDQNQCLAATVMVDERSSEIGSELLEQLQSDFPDADAETANDTTINFDTCGNLQ